MSQLLLSLRGLACGYQGHRIVQSLELHLNAGDIGCLLGPSGCGKTTTLRAIAGFESVQEGEIELSGAVISRPGFTLAPEKRRIGMVFQDYALFPHLSVADNVAFGIRHHEKLSKADMADRVEQALRQGAQWDEVKDKLGQSALGLSGGQQQRLCIARAVALRPSVLLLDEPTSALDPISTSRIEQLVHELKNDYTIAIVTHNMQQAARCSDFTAYMYLGSLVEYGTTEQIFFKPQRSETEDYITGRFG